jgi:hypothetical protein
MRGLRKGGRGRSERFGGGCQGLGWGGMGIEMRVWRSWLGWFWDTRCVNERIPMKECILLGGK